MRFTTSENKTYRNGDYIPKPWIDYGLGIKDSIEKYYRSKIFLWDFDTCGDDNYYFHFEDGSIHYYEHIWYMNYTDNIDDDEYGPVNEWRKCSETEFNVDDMPKFMKKERDWI